MDIFFQDPTEVPLPPADVRIRQFTAIPWPDGRRVKVALEVDPFQQRPSAEIVILDEQKQEKAQVMVIESMTRKMEFNLHLRQPQPGTYLAQVELFYEQPPAEPAGVEDQPAETTLPRLTVDHAEVIFEITG